MHYAGAYARETPAISSSAPGSHSPDNAIIRHPVGSGPPLHYLVADRSGHAATNFSLAEAGASTQGQCWRYDRIVQTLAASNGKLDAAQAMALLEKVSQQGLTQWSLVYDLSRGQVDVAMGGDYKQVHSFQLPLLDQPK